MKKAHYNPKSLRWLISLIIMLVIGIAVVFGSSALKKLADAKYNTPVDVDFTVAQAVPMSVEENDFNVTSVEKALDAQGNTVAYVIKSSQVGYNAEVPIELETTITADGSVVCSVDVLKQEETEYLGVRIETDDFKNQFKGRKLPIVSSNSIEKGAKVDVIAKSTISSQAVIDGVNNATNYLNTFILEK